MFDAVKLLRVNGMDQQRYSHTLKEKTCTHTHPLVHTLQMPYLVFFIARSKQQ